MHFDVFNGDADGIIALLQLRLSEHITQPKASTLITGVKRDISLLEQVNVEEATSVTVLDISLEKNIDALSALLERNVEVFYVDHHRTGDIPKPAQASEKFTCLINTDANTCTSLIVNQHLNGEFVYWAITAAFGDNMFASAKVLAEQVGLSVHQQEQLKALGTYINYNGYGRSIDDLHFAPADLYQQLLKYLDPFTLINEDENSVFSILKQGYHQDMKQAQSAQVLVDNESLMAILLADEPWARRVSGVFSNELANQSPDKAHLVLTENEQLTDNHTNSTYTVSLRAPLNNKQGADKLCVQFPTGGGRAAAAGINALPKEMLGELFTRVAEYYA